MDGGSRDVIKVVKMQNNLGKSSTIKGTPSFTRFVHWFTSEDIFQKRSYIRYQKNISVRVRICFTATLICFN